MVVFLYISVAISRFICLTVSLNCLQCYLTINLLENVFIYVINVIWHEPSMLQCHYLLFFSFPFMLVDKWHDYWPCFVPFSLLFTSLHFTSLHSWMLSWANNVTISLTFHSSHNNITQSNVNCTNNWIHLFFCRFIPLHPLEEWVVWHTLLSH